MNKPSIKFIRLNQGDVISTSGEAYFTMTGLKNGINGDITFTSPDGNQFGADDFKFPSGTFEGTYFYIDSSNRFTGSTIETYEESDNPNMWIYNGNYTYEYNEILGEYYFKKVN